jgi:hypothetical protein
MVEEGSFLKKISQRKKYSKKHLEMFCKKIVRFRCVSNCLSFQFKVIGNLASSSPSLLLPPFCFESLNRALLVQLDDGAAHGGTNW